MKTDYGQGWLKFYINWRFPLSFILGAISIINEYNEANNNGYFLIPLFFVFFFLDIALYVYRIFVFSAMKQRTPKGYYMNNALLFIEAAYIALSRAVSSAPSLNGEFLIYFLIFFGFMCLIWVWPNRVYFKHRRYLFGILSPEAVSNPSPKSDDYQFESAERNNAQLSYSPHSSNEEVVRFCRYCGSSILPDSRFCPECGKNLVADIANGKK